MTNLSLTKKETKRKKEDKHTEGKREQNHKHSERKNKQRGKKYTKSEKNLTKKYFCYELTDAVVTARLNNL